MFSFSGSYNKIILILTLFFTVHGFENITYTMREILYEHKKALGEERVDSTFKLNVKGTTHFGAALSLIGRITSEAGPDTGQSVQHVYCTLAKEITMEEHLASCFKVSLNS